MQERMMNLLKDLRDRRMSRMSKVKGRFFLVMAMVFCAGKSGAIPPSAYIDDRPQAGLRLEAKDQGVVLKHGGGPGDCDLRGAREAIVFQDKDVYYLHYDAAGPKGWLASLATSKDLVHWEKRGPILDFGKPGAPDSASASAPWVIHDGEWWHMFYLGTPNVSPKPDYVPMFPYQTLKARSRSPSGPWEKQYEAAPFTAQPGTYYSSTASPGDIVKWNGEFLMFFSASTSPPDVKRTLSIARAKSLDGPWVVQAEPILPLEEQIENSSLYYEPEIQTWFLFTNHIGINDQKQEFTDAVWVYWSKDLNRWDAKNKAVVLDGRNCSWSKNCIGMPSVIKAGQRLAVLYDAPGGDSIGHMNRDIGLAWLDLPLVPPK
ncbi:MAG: hypothetical protein D4R65_08290 [Verrucomicrobiaceae bacterium]|nr:MAG: hypothetical protein D4R65_08290 [Verrucomicrobiaceae bacterium]